MSDSDKVTAQGSDSSKSDVVFASSPSVTAKNSGAPVFADGSRAGHAGTTSSQKGSYKRASYRTAVPEKHTKKSKFKIIAISAVSAMAVVGICISAFAFLGGGNGGEKLPAVATAGDESSETKMQLKDVNTDSIAFGKNVTIQGIDVSGMTLSKAYSALDEAQKSVRDKINVTVKNGKKTFTLTEDDFIFDYNTSEVLLEAYHYSRGELENLSVKYNKNDSTGITDFPLKAELSENAVDYVTNKIADKVNVKAVDAHVDKFEPTATEKFTYKDGTVGKQLDSDDMSLQLSDIIASNSKTGTVTPKLTDVPFSVDLKTIKKKTELVASFETTSTNVWASNHNMQIALEQINGSIINPGETWSFNEASGDSTTPDLGYVKSTAIVNGGYEAQYGGGVCQAATTIYNAGLRANMEIIERLPHQYASTYVPVGLDATIDYGNIDLKMKNTSAFPLYMATYMYDNNGDGCPELMVELYGEKPTAYDEIVPIAWCVENNGSKYSTYSARVYFKDGKEIKRERVWRSTYDYHGESAYQLAIPDDIENGPKDVSPTGQEPKHYG